MAMLSLGICLAYQAKAPILTCVALTGTRSTAALEHAFDLKTSSDTPVEQLDDLARQVRSQLNSITPDRVVIRIADTSRTPNNSKAPRTRLMIEGAVAFAAREFVAGEVFFRSGKETGQALALSKDSAVTRGAEFDEKRKDAAAAALSGLDS